EAVVDELSGVVEDAPDDRSLALFGYPEVLEDNAKRAVYAGLEILRRVPLTTVAVHAGTALALSDLDGAELALGPLFDQSGDHLALAEAGSLRVSPEAHTLCADAFHWHEVDRNGYVPTGVKEADFGRRPAVPLVARDVELQQILDAWERARQGEGQVVVVGGEAGLGKSRLLTEVRTRLGRHETVPAWVTAFSSPLSSATPFEPIARVLRIQSGTEVATSPEAKLAALEEWLRQAALDLPELAPWLALVLGIPTAGRYPSEQMGPSLRKRRILEALASTILELAQRQPSVVVLEDLHWADPSTLEVLDLLVEQAHSVPLLLIMSHRLEYRPPWVDRPDVSWIRLQRLAPTQVEEQISMLVEQVSGVSADLPRELLQRVAERADGVPLFVEELLRAVVEAENWDDDAHRQLADAAVPQSLRESLMARLARLGPAKAMAQRASVIGRTFGIEILASVAEIPQPVLEDGLEQLVRAEILIRRGFGPRTRFVFRHALLRDAAYESLLRRDRKRLHRKVAEFLESQDGTRPELLARHQTLGGTWAAAARNWQSAAMEAQLQSAFLEAVEHGRAAIDALSKARRRLRSPEAREQADRRELTMQTQLGAALAATQGYAAPELAEVYGRARCLCDRLGNDPGLVWVLWGLYAYHVVESRLHEALELADQLLRITETDDDPIPRLVALAAKAVALYFHGDVEEAYEIALEAAALDDPSRSEHLHRATGQDMGANVLSCVSLAAWHLGRTEDALETSSASLELAQRIEHPFSIAFTGSWAARLHQSLRDADGCRRLAEVVRQASETRGYFWTTQAHFFSGCAAAEELRRRVDTGASVGAEEWSDALAEMRTGLDSYRATGARLSQSYMLAQIAEVQLWAGQLEPARESIRDAMAAATTGREGYWRSELHRLAGEVEMAGEAPDLESAEADLVIAKDLATAAGDRALLQRAESSLQRLYDFLHLPRDADR
ncbi:MAG: AAA family ATPase, partial [Thermoanaerobaculia bacterium]|nr:AAA family ATPase [Thermoanaerobaculia bacterium]